MFFPGNKMARFMGEDPLWHKIVSIIITIVCLVFVYLTVILIFFMEK